MTSRKMTMANIVSLTIDTIKISTDLSALLDRHSATLPVGHLPALLVRDLPAVGLGHVPAVVDGDGLAVLAGLEALALAVGGKQHVSPVGGLASLHVICNTGQSDRGLGCQQENSVLKKYPVILNKSKMN